MSVFQDFPIVAKDTYGTIRESRKNVSDFIEGFASATKENPVVTAPDGRKLDISTSEGLTVFSLELQKLNQLNDFIMAVFTTLKNWEKSLDGSASA